MFFVERFIILCPYYGGPLSEVPLFLVNMKVENVPCNAFSIPTCSDNMKF